MFACRFRKKHAVPETRTLGGTLGVKGAYPRYWNIISLVNHRFLGI
jgi:hypothetical protein